jgi:hypothetical protein
MRAIKYAAWEGAFLDKIAKVRESELLHAHHYSTTATQNTLTQQRPLDF